jgi:hypothetical protein
MAKRRDGFCEERKRLFLTALSCGEGVLGACALVGVSNRTAYNHQKRDPDFARGWDLAVRSWKLPLDLVAFERAVTGVEEPVYAYGKLAYHRVRRSDPLLIKLLQVENPAKYGRAAGMKGERKRLEKRLRKRLEAEIAPLREAVAALQSARNSSPQAVNFVNPGDAPAAAPLAAPRRGKRRGGWRLAAARRRGGEAGISIIPRSS